MTVSKATTRTRKSINWFRIGVIVLLGVAVFRWFGRESSGPEVGSAAKAFTLPLVNATRQSVSLNDYRGRPVVIEVFAHWCGACRSMAPRLAELAQAQRSKPAQFLGVAVDGSATDLQYLHQSWGIPFDVALGDPEFSSNYRVTVLPTIILLDAEGRVAHVTTGITSVSRIDGWLADLGAPRLMD